MLIERTAVQRAERKGAYLGEQKGSWGCCHWGWEVKTRSWRRRQSSVHIVSYKTDCGKACGCYWNRKPLDVLGWGMQSVLNWTQILPTFKNIFNFEKLWYLKYPGPDSSAFYNFHWESAVVLLGFLYMFPVPSLSRTFIILLYWILSKVFSSYFEPSLNLRDQAY